MRIGLGLATIAVGGALAVAGCDRRTVVECSGASAASPVVSIVKEELERQVSNKVRGDGAARLVSLSKIRAAINQLTISLDDIRTSKEDPNSTKRFCSATLKVRFASDLLDDADRARTATESSSVSDLADANEVERRADSFSAPIDFNIQPTDDGSKVFAETESGNNLFGFAAEVLASALIRAKVEEGQRAEDQASAAAEQEQQNALVAQRAANLESAKTDNQLAVQTIGATWKALADETRARLLPVQRAWIRKKEADCRVEAASTSIDPSEREVARLMCDTRITQERITWLAGYRTDDVAPSSVLAEDAGADL